MKELDLGSGPHKIKNAIGVDVSRTTHPNIIYDLNKISPILTNTV